MRLTAPAALAAATLTLILVLQPQAARALTVEQRLIAGLTTQGYVILEDGRTFLGRLRIVAENGTYRREIVVNPETGEVLRDYAVLLWPDGTGGGQPSDPSGAVVASNGGGSGSTSSAAVLIEGTSTGTAATGTATTGTATTSTATTGTAGVTTALTGVPRSGSDASDGSLPTDPALTMGVTAP